MSTFPTVGLMPKEEIEAANFINENPQYDGRGTVVAIFDSGVDPGATGLQTTSDGKPKIIDIVDATGSGDVDTSVVKEGKVSAEGVIEVEGLSGRTLKLGKYNNPSGKWHVGIKSGFELFTAPLIDRVKKERRKSFDAKQRETKANLTRTIEEFDKAHPDKSKLNADEQKAKKDLDARLSQLEELEKSYNDIGPIYDCVVFHDGEHYQALIDTQENGDLINVEPLTDYRLKHQYSTFSAVDFVNFVVNIYDDGNVLSIVTDCSPHGTHVAGIVAAYHPDQPELNGIAPGAQLVSVRIGDSRLGSEETGTGVIRGLIAAKRAGADLINMSYGEATHRPNSGRPVELITEFVHKHGIIFVSSGGNNGPALSSVGAPGGTTHAVIGVGAAVSPDMMPVEYSLREKLPEIMYTWSSRGPSFDGHLGISVCAPGGAFAPVPTWTLKKYDHMNGTSMSSPNCCGGIALILSALKANNIPYRPNSIRQAIENTARPIEGMEQFAVGYGLIQVKKAYKFLENSKENPDLRYDISVKKKRGIFLSTWEETQNTYEATVTVNAVWHDDTQNSEKVKYERRILLKSTASWIQSPQYLVSITGVRTFNVKVDPTRLEYGTANYGEVLGIDAANPGLGPLFRLPVTVIRPKKIGNEDDFIFRSGELSFRPGVISRNFLYPPAGATSAELTIRAKDIDTRRTFAIHTQQRKRHVPYKDTEHGEFFILTPTDEKKYQIKIIDNACIEVALAQFWSSLGDSKVEYDIVFRGLDVAATDGYKLFLLNGNDNVLRVDFGSAFKNEVLTPAITLSKIRKPLRPSEAVINTLNKDRDSLPDNRIISQLVLTYKFKIEDPVEESICVIPKLSDLLYDSPFECQFWMIYDSNKRLIGKGDAFPSHYPSKLGKGDYVLRVALRHEQRDKLEKLKEMVVYLEHKLGDAEKKGFDVKIYSTLQNSLVEGPNYSKKSLKKGKQASLYLKATGYPPKAKGGEVIVGTFSFQKDINYDFHYVVPIAKVTPPPSSASNDVNNKKTEEEKMTEFLLNQSVTYLSQLVQKKQFEDYKNLVKSILDKNPVHLPLLQLELHSVDNAPNRSERLKEVIAAAEKVISAIDRTALAIHYGTKYDPEDPEQSKERKEKDSQKEILIDALYRKGIALFDLNVQNDPEGVKAFEENNKEFRKWVEAENVKFADLEIKYHLKSGLLGLGLQVASKHLGTVSSSEPLKKQLHETQISLVEKLGWDHLAQHLKKAKLVNYPPAFQPF